MILQNIQAGKIPLVLTQKLCLEYESVLTRKTIMKLIDVNLEEVRLVLDALLALAQLSEVFYMWRPNLPDEKDNFVLEAAVATSALIIKKNIVDFQRSELKFSNLIVLTPQQFCNLYL